MAATSWLHAILGPPQAASANKDDWPSPGRRTAAGVSVTDENALTYAPLWAALRAINETLAALPLVLYRADVAGDRERARDHPLYAILDAAPNPSMPAMTFREGRYYHVDWYGNGFAEIERDPATGAPVALWPIHPTRVRKPTGADRYRDGREVPLASYLVRSDGGGEVALPAEDVLHLPGVFSDDGVWGKGVRQFGANSVGFGLAVDRHGAGYFAGGGQPKAVLHLPGMRDHQQRQRFREEWRQVHNAESGPDVVILPVEGKYDRITHAPGEAQYLETRTYNVKDVARFLRVPVYMLEEYERAASYASVEMRGLEFVTYSLLPRARRIEQQIGLKLLRPDERGRLYCEHLFAQLLRGDFQARMRGYQTALMTGIMTINEVRRLENLSGIGPEGDEHYVPMNVTTSRRMAAGPPPPASGRGARAAAEDARARVEAALVDVRRDVEAHDRPAAAAQPLPPSSAIAPLDVATAVLADAASRWLIRFAVAAEKESRNSDFPSWAQNYVARQRPALAESLSAAALALASAGRVALASDLAARVGGRSLADLLRAYDVLGRAEFAAWLSSWPGRAGELAAFCLASTAESDP